MEQFRFANPEYLWVIVLAFGLLLFAVWANRRSQQLLERLAHPKNLGWMVGKLGQLKPTAPDYFLAAAIVFLGLALMRPQADPVLEEINAQGLDIVIALDLSKSMDAEDAFPSRLRLAKKKIGDMLNKLSSDRVAIVAFASTAHLIIPLTSDYDLIRTFLPSIETNLLDNQGSNLETALDAAVQSFEKGSATTLGDETPGHIIILMSDGEENTGSALEAMGKIKENGITIHTIAFGTERGSPIPVRDAGGVLQGHKRDNLGNTVMTQVNYKPLQDIAAAANGHFAFASVDNSDIDSILSASESAMKTRGKAAQARLYQELYDIPLGLAICCLIIFFLSPALKAKRRRVRTAAFLLLLFVGTQNTQADGANTAQDTVLPWYSFFWTKDKQVTEQAKNLIAAGKAEEAHKLLSEAQLAGVNTPQIQYNTATALAKTEKTDEAKSEFADGERFGAALQDYTEFNRAGLEAKSGNKEAAVEGYFDQIKRLQKKDKRSPSENAVLEQAIKNMELVQKEINGQSQQKQSDSDKGGAKDGQGQGQQGQGSQQQNQQQNSSSGQDEQQKKQQEQKNQQQQELQKKLEASQAQQNKQQKNPQNKKEQPRNQAQEQLDLIKKQQELQEQQQQDLKQQQEAQEAKPSEPKLQELEQQLQKLEGQEKTIQQNISQVDKQKIKPEEKKQLVPIKQKQQDIQKQLEQLRQKQGQLKKKQEEQKKEEQQSQQAQQGEQKQKPPPMPAGQKPQHRFEDRQDLNETDAKRILENLKTQETDLQKKLLKMQINKNGKQPKNNNDKDW